MRQCRFDLDSIVYVKTLLEIMLPYYVFDKYWTIYIYSKSRSVEIILYLYVYVVVFDNKVELSAKIITRTCIMYHISGAKPFGTW